MSILVKGLVVFTCAFIAVLANHETSPPIEVERDVLVAVGPIQIETSKPDQRATTQQNPIATTTTTTTTTTVVPFQPTMPGVDPALCRTADARDFVERVPFSVGFPLDGNTPATGTIKVVLLPIDFSDAIGTEQEIFDAQNQIDKFNKWVESQSRSALTVDWVFPDDWWRLSKESSEYGLNPEAIHAAMTGDARSYFTTVETFGTEAVALADPSIDFTDVEFVFVLLPKTITQIDPHVGAFHLNIPSDEGTITKLWGGGAFFYRQNYDGRPKELWTAWIHEIGHTWGLAGHAPVATLGREQEVGSTESDLHLMGNQDAVHKVFSIWDQWLLGWLPEEEVYCLPVSHLLPTPEIQSTEVELVTLDRLNENGYRTAMVPVTRTSILVVESRDYGIVVYLVDTTLDYDRSAENRGVALDRFATYLTDLVLHVGETISYERIGITVVRSGAISITYEMSELEQYLESENEWGLPDEVWMDNYDPAVVPPDHFTDIPFLIDQMYRFYERGPHIVKLQQLLGMQFVDGIYGPATRRVHMEWFGSFEAAHRYFYNRQTWYSETIDPEEDWRHNWANWEEPPTLLELINLYFLPEDSEWALRVAFCESSALPDDTYSNAVSSALAVGWFQHLSRYWLERSERSGWYGYDIFDTEPNVAVAAWLFYKDGNSHWNESKNCWKGTTHG
jgi:hypothetical protein